MLSFFVYFEAFVSVFTSDKKRATAWALKKYGEKKQREINY